MTKSKEKTHKCGTLCKSVPGVCPKFLTTMKRLHDNPPSNPNYDPEAPVWAAIKQAHRNIAHLSGEVSAVEYATVWFAELEKLGFPKSAKDKELILARHAERDRKDAAP